MLPSARQISVTLASRVEFHRLQFHQEAGKDPLVGSSHVGRYIEVEPATLEAIQTIQSYASLDEAEAKLAGPGDERPDLIELVQAMHRAGLVSSVDGKEVPPLESMEERHAFLRRVPPAKARLIRHPVVLLLCAASILFGLEVFILKPSLIPSYRDLHLFERPSLALASIMGGMLLMAYLHELAHFFTARSYGIEARINISNRFYIVILQTDVTQAHTLGRLQKTAIFCAGIVFNLAMVGLGAGLDWVIRMGILEASARQEAFLRYFMAINFLPLMFQLFLFARTDLYHILAAWTGHRNLLQDSRRYMALQGEKLVSWFLSNPHSSCAPCGRSLFEFEPYCPRCGALRRVRDPNKYPFKRRDRWVFSLFGTVTIVGPLYFFLGMGRYLLHFFYNLFQINTALGRVALQERNLLVGIETTLVLFLLGVQAYFMVKFLLGMAAFLFRGGSWALRFYYQRRYPFFPPLVSQVFQAGAAVWRTWQSIARPAWRLYVQPLLPVRQLETLTNAPRSSPAAMTE